MANTKQRQIVKASEQVMEVQATAMAFQRTIHNPISLRAHDVLDTLRQLMGEMGEALERAEAELNRAAMASVAGSGGRSPLAA